MKPLNNLSSSDNVTSNSDDINNWKKSQSLLNSIGMAGFDVPSDVTSFLKENINYKNSYTKNLAGHLKEEYRYDGWPVYVEKWIMSLMDINSNLTKMLSYNGIQVLTRDLPLCLETMWVNKQKKHEFNPFHTHKGVFSFIIFLQIPYDLEEEYKLFPNTSFNKPATSNLNFYAVNTLGAIQCHTLSVDKSFENKMIMFPAKLPHSVNPFYTSDDYRITVSGNISLSVNGSKYENKYANTD